MYYFRHPDKLWDTKTHLYLDQTEDVTGNGIRIFAHRCGSYDGFESSLNAALIAIENGA